ncbi:MAG: hypothetical protein VX479_02555, partial [Verrucomicrobiota bacterium]|nr:hypothetical protein [Verrucomicrobiota bacterium]
ADATTVTIEWQGQVIPLPLATLSPASQALAQKLSGGSAPVPPPAPSAPVVPQTPTKPQGPKPTIVTG